MIAAFRYEDTTPVRQIHRHHLIRRLHEVLQRQRRRDVVRQHDRHKSGARLRRHAELHAPPEQKPRNDPVPARDGGYADAGLAAFQRDGALFTSLKKRRGRLRRASGAVFGGSVKPFSDDLPLALVPTTGRAEG